MGSDETSTDHDLPTELAPTSLERVAAVRERLADFGITHPDGVRMFLGVLDRLGLFHDPTTEKGLTTKKATRLAQKAKALLDRLKILWRTFQVNRGGRIIPARSTGGKRADQEITRALQILDRYLSECFPEWTGRKREACLADVLRGATGQSVDLRQAVIDQVHARLQTAKKRTPLDEMDYRIADGDALGVESKENADRKQAFLRLQAVLNNPQSSEEERAHAEAEMERLFGLNNP